MNTQIVSSLRYFLTCLVAVLLSAAVRAQRYYAPLPFGMSVYDTATRVPVAVQYSLQAWHMGSAKRVAAWPFLSDIPDSVCTVRSSFYARSGYDRGHLLPAASRSADAGLMRSTFVMSNVAPQIPTLNRGQWKRAEDEERLLAKKFGYVNVYNAPIFFLNDTAWIMPRLVAIPHAFLKVILNERCDSIIRYWFFLNR